MLKITSQWEEEGPTGALRSQIGGPATGMIWSELFPPLWWIRQNFLTSTAVGEFSTSPETGNVSRGFLNVQNSWIFGVFFHVKRPPKEALDLWAIESGVGKYPIFGILNITFTSLLGNNPTEGQIRAYDGH